MKHSVKRLAALAVSLILALSFAMTAYAGTWVYDGPENWKWWYREDDGSYPANVWKQIDGSWYHFGEGGYLNVGAHEIDGKWYYLENTSDGNVGKMRISGSWDYGYITGDGSIVTYYPGYEGGYEAYSTPVVMKDPSTNQAVKSVDGTWYSQIFEDIIKESDIGMLATEGRRSGEMNYTLPDNWEEICPVCFINELVRNSVGYTNGGTYDYLWHWEWAIDGNNLKVSFYYYDNPNPEGY